MNGRNRFIVAVCWPNSPNNVSIVSQFAEQQDAEAAIVNGLRQQPLQTFFLFECTKVATVPMPEVQWKSV